MYQTDKCPYCELSHPHAGPTGCPPFKEWGLYRDFEKFLACGEPPMTPADVMQEVEEEWNAEVAEQDEDEPVTFAVALSDYYHNLMDDLHDSAGDREYQAAHLERMAIVERWVGEGFSTRAVDFGTYTLTDKAPEIRWFFGEEGEVA